MNFLEVFQERQDGRLGTYLLNMLTCGFSQVSVSRFPHYFGTHLTVILRLYHNNMDLRLRSPGDISTHSPSHAFP